MGSNPTEGTNVGIALFYIMEETMSVRRRNNVNQDCIIFPCPKCEAKKNRKCTSLTHSRWDGALREPHKARVELYLNYELEKYKPVTIDNAKLGLKIRSHDSGDFGTIKFIAEKAYLIKWENGKESKETFENDLILSWVA